MSRLIEVEAFVAVVAEGSFVGAAERLEVSASYVSKLVSRLEARLGTRLLSRSTRSLSLTEPGRRLHADCAEALGLVEAAEDALLERRAIPAGTLRVTLPTSIGQVWLSRAVAEFMAAWPAVALDALYTDRTVDLIAEGFDVAVRAGDLPDSALVARRLATARRRVVASPAYLARRGRPETVDALRDHPCLLYTGARAPSTWTLARGDEVCAVTVSGPMAANSGVVLADAARCGVGLAFLPDFHTARYLADGALVDALPGWGTDVPVHAVYPGARLRAPKVRVFVDAIAEALAAAPWGVGG